MQLCLGLSFKLGRISDLKPDIAYIKTIKK